MQRFCLTLKLKPDSALIAEYEERHRHSWPEVQQSFRDAGIRHMEIYRQGERLILTMETDDSFTFERKAEIDRASAKVMQWEREMSKYQLADPNVDAGGKWQRIESIFTFEDQR
jgi:L-rhamnose mutarotase